jgi:hypothetical protein
MRSPSALTRLFLLRGQPSSVLRRAWHAPSIIRYRTSPPDTAQAFQCCSSMLLGGWQ